MALRIILTVSVLLTSLFAIVAVGLLVEDTFFPVGTGSTTVAAENFQIVKGSAISTDTGSILSFPQGDNRIILSYKSPVSASSIYALDIHLGKLPHGVNIGLFWRKTRASRPRLIRLPAEPDGGYLPVIAGRKGWMGEIAELGLILQGSTKDSFLFEGISFLSPGLLRRLQTDLKSLFYFKKPWDQRSINFLSPSRTLSEASLTAIAGIWLGAVVLLVGLLAIFSRLRPAAGGVLLAAFVVVWMILDVRWQYGLNYNVLQARERYKGKSWTEKAETGISLRDGDLFRQASYLKAKVLPNDPQKIFLVVDSNEFDRLRFRYHLLPHKVSSRKINSKTLPFEKLKKGDYILLVRNKGRIKFDSERGKLFFIDKSFVPAEKLYESKLAVLYKALGNPLERAIQ